jgi:hypothetical protein
LPCLMSVAMGACPPWVKGLGPLSANTSIVECRYGTPCGRNHRAWCLTPFAMDMRLGPINWESCPGRRRHCWAIASKPIPPTTAVGPMRQRWMGRLMRPWPGGQGRGKEFGVVGLGGMSDTSNKNLPRASAYPIDNCHRCGTSLRKLWKTQPVCAKMAL